MSRPDNEYDLFTVVDGSSQLSARPGLSMDISRALRSAASQSRLAVGPTDTDVGMEDVPYFLTGVSRRAEVLYSPLYDHEEHYSTRADFELADDLACSMGALEYEAELAFWAASRPTSPIADSDAT
jgi:hypothetical protein